MRKFPVLLVARRIEGEIFYFLTFRQSGVPSGERTIGYIEGSESLLQEEDSLHLCLGDGGRISWSLDEAIIAAVGGSFGLRWIPEM
jgi:hypothetical protein